MADLIQEFFQRDLTEAEQEALSQSLQGSPEEALRYERLLEQNYLATGLPSPSLPKGLGSLPGTAASLASKTVLPQVMAFLVCLAVAGVAVWKFWPKTELAPSAPGLAASMEAKPIQALSRVAPEKLRAARPQAEGDELSVVVAAAERSLVTVRVLDPAGHEVRALYTGFVDPGHWSFQWDGRLGDGEPAAPGDYLIDVQSGGAHQTKSLHIHVRPALP
jgi:hypothetical protein